MERICNEGYRPERPGNAPEALWSLMTRCWDKTPEERPTFAEIAKKLDDIVAEKLGHDLAALAL